MHILGCYRPFGSEKEILNLNLFSFFLNCVPFKRSWPFSRTSLKSLHKKTKQIKQNYVKSGLNWCCGIAHLKAFRWAEIGRDVLEDLKRRWLESSVKSHCRRSFWLREDKRIYLHSLKSHISVWFFSKLVLHNTNLCGYARLIKGCTSTKKTHHNHHIIDIPECTSLGCQRSKTAF